MPGHNRTMSNPKELDDWLQKVRAAAYKHPDNFVQTQLKVADKVSNVFQFKYNWPQQQMAQSILLQENQGLPVRQFYLKSRQVGTTTMVAARNFTRCWARDNTEAVFVAHYEDRAAEILERVKFFYASMHPKLRLALSRDSKFGIQFADTRSKMTIISSKNIDQAKGGTKQHGHLTEFVYYKRPMHILEEVSQPITRAGGTSIIIETTGFGYDSEAHRFWRSCRAGKEIFQALFLPWQDDPTTIWGENLSQKELDYYLGMAFEYEPRLLDRMKQHKLPAQKVLYSFWQLRDQLYGNWEKYLQEYPCDEDEAWRTSDGSWFGTEVVAVLMRMVKEYEQANFYTFEDFPLSQMFEKFEDLNEVPAVEELEWRRKPFLKVWRKPRANRFYIVVSDSAGGEQDGNFSSTFVIDGHTLEMMCEFNGRIRPDEHAYLAASLGNIYNGALAAPEVNNHGLAMLQQMKTIYHNFYRWQTMDDHKPKKTNKIGWYTNGWSRPLMLGVFKQIVQDIAQGRLENSGIIRSKGLVKEMVTFVEKDTGKPEAMDDTCSDDRILAISIAYEVALQETSGGAHDILKHLYGADIASGDNSQRQSNLILPRQDPADVILKAEMDILGEYGFNGWFQQNGDGGGNEHGWF